jgi:uncharacterized protein with von Willebrand factor type A (vWA) domain
MPETAPRAFTLDPAMLAVGFVDALRRAGMPCTPERTAWLVRSLRLATPVTRSDLYWMCRTVLVSSQQQLARFDTVFDVVFGGGIDTAEFRGDRNAPDDGVLQPRSTPDTAGVLPPSGLDRGAPAPVGPGAGGAGDDERGATDALLLVASPEERLHSTAFDALSPDEVAHIRRLVAAIVLSTPMRPGRRDRVSPRASDRLDLRRTVRAARRTGGDAVRLVHAERLPRPRPLVLLCDVSASMEPFTRVFLSLMQAAVVGSRAEAFVFATRLTRLTRQLSTRDADRALDAAARAAEDWAGGTRLADGIRSFIEEHGRRGIARGAVVVIFSDGWAQDDPADIDRAMGRLSRLAYRIVWVNPRRAARDYQPLAGGMAAALPYCDAFVSGHSFDALQELVRAIADDGSHTMGKRIA